MHGEVGVNVTQENDDDVAMPDVALHELLLTRNLWLPLMMCLNPVSTRKPVAIVNDVFRNTLADDTEANDGISQLLRNVEVVCLSDRQLKS
jgi:hypothetical protein